MPLLPAEPETYPEDLFAADSPAAEDRLWRVLHTKPRQEKSLARQLHRHAIPHYLPLVRRRRRIRGRTLTAHIPLFPGYVFLLGDGRDRVTALATRRVVRALEVGDQERLWHDLRQLRRLIAAGAPVTPEDRLAPGSLVEVKSGPLAGLRGKILRSASGRRFVVEVDFIQRGASVMLDDFVLTPIKD